MGEVPNALYSERRRGQRRSDHSHPLARERKNGRIPTSSSIEGPVAAVAYFRDATESAKRRQEAAAAEVEAGDEVEETDEVNDNEPEPADDTLADEDSVVTEPTE